MFCLLNQHCATISNHRGSQNSLNSLFEKSKVLARNKNAKRLLPAMTPYLPPELVQQILDCGEIPASFDDAERTSFLRSASLNSEWREIARIQLYRHVVLPTPASAAAFLLLLKSDASIAALVDTLRLGIASGIGSEAMEGKWRIATLLKALSSLTEVWISGLRSIELRDLGNGKGWRTSSLFPRLS